MEPLTSLVDTSNPTANQTPDTISRDVSSIKQKVHGLLNEHNIHQEWILLAHIINRLCFIIYLFFLSFSIGHHLFL